MTQAKPWEFMVRFTPQREWIERRGMMLWLAFFFIELGAGTFIIASIFGSLPGKLTGWLICALLGGGLHLLYLGRPSQAWRILLSSGWKTSWISRGLIFVLLFLILGAISMVLTRWASAVPGLSIAAAVFAFCAVIYGSFAMNFVNAIPLWNTALLPLLYAVMGIWGGLGVTLIALLATAAPAAMAGSAEQWSRIFLLAFGFIVFVYLFGVRYQGKTGKVSVEQIVAGRMAPLFWIMVVILGIAFPAAVAGSSWFVTVPAVLLYIVIAFELLCDLALRYCLLRSGLYAPLIPSRDL